MNFLLILEYLNGKFQNSPSLSNVIDVKKTVALIKQTVPVLRLANCIILYFCSVIGY